jgi:hypothetical protein
MSFERSKLERCEFLERSAEIKCPLILASRSGLLRESKRTNGPLVEMLLSVGDLQARL